MKVLILIGIFFTLTLTGCRETVKKEVAMHEPKEWIVSENFRIPVYDFSGLEPMLRSENDTLYVINFWASWCKPCVKEMPYFIAAERYHEDSPFRLLLVSLDFRSEAEKELIPFMQKQGLNDQVILLSDPDADTWIRKVSEDWSGALPATLFYRNGKEYFHEGTLSEEELNEIINQFI